VKDRIATMLNDAARVWSDAGMMGGTAASSSSLWTQRNDGGAEGGKGNAADGVGHGLGPVPGGGLQQTRKKRSHSDSTHHDDCDDIGVASSRDFGSVPTHLERATHRNAGQLSSAGFQGFSNARMSLSEELWSVLDEIIVLNDCEVYTYLSGLNCSHASSGTPQCPA